MTVGTMSIIQSSRQAGR